MSFEEMLNEIYDNLDTQKREKLVLPKVELNVTTTNTHWLNVKNLLKIIDRPPDHFVSVMNKNIGDTNWKTSSKSDGLIIIGKIKKERIFAFIKSYMKDYVICNICKSYNTTLKKNSNIRQLQLHCKNCNSIYTV